MPLGICFGCILWEYGADICPRTRKRCVLCFLVFDNFSVLCSWPAVRSTTNHNNGVEQQQALQQQGLWEYVSEVYSGSMERTYAPGHGNAQTSSNHFRSQFSRRVFLLLLVLCFLVFDNFCVLCSWPAAVRPSRRPSGRLSGRLGV